MAGNIETNKKAAVEFMRMIASGKIDEAYEKFIDLKGRHHNAYFPAGFPVLREAMKESHVKFPAKQFQIKNVVGDNDLAAVHSHIALQPGDKGLAAVHMFRFRDNKIVEMWDIVQPIPDSLPNKDGIF